MPLRTFESRPRYIDVRYSCTFELNNVLEATDEQHNDDSLLQYMLFSSGT